MPPTRARISIESKVELLNKIKDKKDILLGRFSDELQNKSKVAAWEEILVLAKHLGLATANRKWQWVRDSLWGVWKSRTLTKKENRNQTGGRGGKKNVLDQCDHLILEIIGPDSPTIEGLPNPESGQVGDVVEDPAGLVFDEDEVRSAIGDNGWPNDDEPTCSRYLQRAERRRVRNGPTLKELQIKKKQKQLELLDSEKYKSKLECLRLERELGLPASELTKTIVPAAAADTESDSD